ncbi:MAG: hypothetical protein N3A38_08970 [Planctomycetota bacterium]|nr:hypothetical protein [Planctomycetota bacterium]
MSPGGSRVSSCRLPATGFSAKGIVMNVPSRIRCPRCATQVKAGKQYCPSCGKDLAPPAETASHISAPAGEKPGAARQAPAGAEVRPAARQTRAIPPADRSSKKLCAVCLQSFPESNVEVVDGRTVCKQCMDVLRTKKVKTREHAEAAPQGAGSAASSPKAAGTEGKVAGDAMGGGEAPAAKPSGHESPVPGAGQRIPTAPATGVPGEEKVCTICGRTTSRSEEIDGKIVCPRCVASGKFKGGAEAAGSEGSGAATPYGGTGAESAPEPGGSSARAGMSPTGDSAATRPKQRAEGGKTCSVCWNKFPADEVVVENGAAICRKCMEARRSGALGISAVAGAGSEAGSSALPGAMPPARAAGRVGGSPAGTHPCPSADAGPMPGADAPVSGGTIHAHEPAASARGGPPHPARGAVPSGGSGTSSADHGAAPADGKGEAAHAEGAKQAKKAIPPEELKAVEIKKEPPSLIAPIIAGILILIFLVWMLIRLLTAAPQEEAPGKKGGMLRPPPPPSDMEKAT